MAATAARPSLGLSRLLQSTTLSPSSSAASSLTSSITTRTLFLSQRSPSPPSFSTTAPLSKRRRHKTRDNNRLRGVSSINRTGPREFLSVSNEPLPRPRVKTAAEQEQEDRAGPIDPTHPLWEFFYEPGKLFPEPVDDAKHGRGWTVEELRRKGWDDLHRLWYKCVKEQNRIATAAYARSKSRLGFGGHEAETRHSEVKKTMSGIKHVLRERYYAWEDAAELAKSDPEINLSGDGPVYTPREYLVEDVEEVYDVRTGAERILAEREAELAKTKEQDAPKA